MRELVTDHPDSGPPAGAPPASPQGTPDPPWTADLAHLLRLEVGRFRMTERRRVFPPGLHTGVPAGPRLEVEGPPASHLEHGLRVELAVALLERARAGLDGRAAQVWLTRTGVPELHDEDQQWYAAARWAWASLDERLDGFFVVTKNGWLDVTTGERRVWKRLRL